ncbi:ribosomal protein S18-alanine N-acetyltransferase [Almyronema epifaneia]|uniref:Ribosomal protein S18-alanine N-acetyltransferase n=1 Tax=Almyronema epifaneia S1 TaxID=2991925 RepID=A0ABW6IB88_9CYAN
MPAIQLDSLSETDLPQALELDQRCFGGLWSLAGYQRELASSNSNFVILRLPIAPADACSPSELKSPSLIGIGCFWRILEEAHITLLGIDPAYQKQGLGTLLLSTLLQQARQQEMERATLEVRASNQAAQHLYWRFGFQAVGRRRHYYPDGEDGLILWRNGLHQPEFAVELQQQQQSIGDRLLKQGWQLNYSALEKVPNSA